MDKFIKSNESDLQIIYLVTFASEEEIERKEYIEVFGLKISSNPKKHAIIKDVKMESSKE